MSNLSTTSNNQNMAKAAAVSAAALQQALAATQIKSRPYTAFITRKQPSAFVFLIDQSGSMSEEITFANQRMSKAEAVANVLNQTLQELLDKCQKSDGLREYFDLAIIGYGQDSSEANFAWEGNISDKQWVTMEELYENKLGETTIVTGSRTLPNGKVVEKKAIFGQWLSPIHASTPMQSALTMAAEILEQWIVAHQGIECYPPTVINITDGAATDAENLDLLKAAKRIKTLHTEDGNVLLFNIHLSSSSDEKVIFPTQAQQLPDDEYARLLFDMASELPQTYSDAIAVSLSKDKSQHFTAMTFNADASTLIQVMNIGTTPANTQIQQGAQ